jgi:hypothetical protein
MIGLLVIFGVIYALSRDSQPTGAAPAGSPLVADPNSSPVEPAKPATGESEAGIPSGGTTNQTANSNANASASPESAELPTDIGNTNANEHTNENSNTKKPLPSPTRTVDEEPPPPPLPTATNPPIPKPSVAPTIASTPELH